MSDDELKKNEVNIPSNPKGGEVSSKSIAGNKLDIKAEKKPVNDSVESKEKENEIISGDSVKKNWW